MDEQQKLEFFEGYNGRTHTFGRIGLAIGVVLLVGAPFAMGAVLHAMPDLGAFGQGLAQIALVYIPSCVVEFLVYAPMLGAGASYLAFITGNILNLKIPCVVNARDIVGAKAGTPENEIISTLSVAASSLVTTLVIAAGVLLLAPLQPILAHPALQPAFNNVVPALFGALACKYFLKGPKVVPLPLAAMTALCILVPAAISSVGFLIVPSGAIAIAVAWVLFKKGKM